VIAHSEKEQAAPTWKHTFGFHPMTAFIDDGPEGTGEAAVLLLRKGNAGSNTAADHITAGRLALAQIPAGRHKQVLIRADLGGGTHGSLNWVTSRRLKYSIVLIAPQAPRMNAITEGRVCAAYAWAPGSDPRHDRAPPARGPRRIRALAPIGRRGRVRARWVRPPGKARPIGLSRGHRRRGRIPLMP
jgi:hypothetical protein